VAGVPVQPLIQRLVELLQVLQLGPRTGPDALRDLLRAVAAQGIQDDPAQASPPAGEWPGEVLNALERGGTDAGDLNAKGLRLHLEAEVLPLASPSGQPTDSPTRTYGPFVDRDGRLVRFAAFEFPALLNVVVRPLVAPDEVVLMVPIDASPSADLRTWRLPAGTVWIRTRLLAAGAAGYAGLRIAGGTLTFGGLSPITRQGASIVAMMQSSFALSVQPEPAAAPGAAAPLSTRRSGRCRSPASAPGRFSPPRTEDP
jgi:hypothetical protein